MNWVQDGIVIEYLANFYLIGRLAHCGKYQILMRDHLNYRERAIVHNILMHVNPALEVFFLLLFWLWRAKWGKLE